MKDNIHHLHQRKIIHVKHAAYPHPNKWVKLLDRIILVAAILGPLTTIPQIYDIFAYKEVAGLSLLTYSFWQVLSIPWLLYGMVHKELPIIISSLLWIAVQTIVIIGILIYA